MKDKKTREENVLTKEEQVINTYLDASERMHSTHDRYKVNPTDENREAFFKATDRFNNVRESMSPKLQKKAIIEWRLRNKKLFITNCLINIKETVEDITEIVELSEK